MSTFTIGKSSPNRSGKSRQQDVHDDNSKRRTLLQDNSWIKKKPEEETTNENYGRVVLNQYKSQDSLHSNLNEKEDQKALLGRYTSDTTLDRVSDSRDSDKANSSPPLDNKPTNRQSLTSSSTSTATTATTTASPVKNKRQSWMPPPVSSYKNTTVTVENKGQSRIPPNTTTTTTVDTKQITSSENSGELKLTNYSSEQITPERSKTAVDNQTGTRAVFKTEVDATMDRAILGFRQECVASQTKVLEHSAGSAVKGASCPHHRNHHHHSQLENKLIINYFKQGSPTKTGISVAEKRTTIERTTRSQDLDNLKENPTPHTNDKGGKDLDDLAVVNTAAQKNKRGQDFGDLTDVKATVDQNKNWTTEQPSDSPNNQADTNYSYGNRGSRNKTSTSYSSPKDAVVFTRTYEETSKSPNNAYEEKVTGKSIKTVYSTSDRTIIDKDMCTYCRKPLGIDAKMILDALQICCHSTCFKCEVCKGPLEDLKAGDSIWIYRNTVHCEPCYSKMKEKWIY